jgi:hypothetical protein
MKNKTPNDNAVDPEIQGLPLYGPGAAAQLERTVRR